MGTIRELIVIFCSILFGYYMPDIYDWLRKRIVTTYYEPIDSAGWCYNCGRQKSWHLHVDLKCCKIPLDKRIKKDFI